jgi:hypothetical protein
MPWERVVATLPRKEALRMSSEGLPYRLPTKKGRRLAVLPTTQLGKWAVGLAGASVVLLFGWSLVGRLGGVPGLAFGLAGGVLALVAIVRRGERALTVFAVLLPFLTVLVFLLAELLIPHG